MASRLAFSIRARNDRPHSATLAASQAAISAGVGKGSK